MTDSARFKSGELQVQSVTTFQPHLHRQSDRRPQLDGKVPPPGINVPTTRIMGSATKHYDRATNAHFRPDKPRGATGKSLIVLNPWLSLNQRVPGSSPGAPTRKPQQINAMLSRAADFCRCLIARVTTGVTDDKPLHPQIVAAAFCSVFFASDERAPWRGSRR